MSRILASYKQLSSRTMQTVCSFLARVLGIALVQMALAAQVAAQAPTADQLELFRNLSPEQQQAIMQQLDVPESTGESQPGAANRRPEAPDQRGRTQRRAQEDRETTPPVFEPNDTLLVLMSLPPEGSAAGAQSLASQGRSGSITGPNRPFVEPVELEAEERRKLEALIELIRSRNPYQLDRNGQLNLPGFTPIPLGGLAEQQAGLRLSAEPALLKLEIRLVRLPLVRTGVEGLDRFGYDLFDEAPSTFSPVTEVPVPADYVVGPGDELNVQLFGSQNRSLRLVVNRDGVVNFPELGPIRVGGQTFSSARIAIEARVSQQMIGVQASVSMGDTRTIRVFVLGEAWQPGSYAVSGLSTMTTALFASGGVKDIGSLRDIQLKRQGQVVRRLDLYDLLIRGDTSDDAKLQPGDVIFIPPVGATISVDGEVRRPAIYELRDETNLADVVQMAGGLTPDADVTRGNLTRLAEGNRRVVLAVNLAESTRQDVHNGDVLRVARLRPQVEGVTLEGFVHRPGPVAWRESLRLSDVIGSVDELRPNADQRYILIRRESGPDRRISVLSADLVQALAAPGSAADVQLMPRDRITVFDLAPGRERIIRPLLDELRLQSELSRPTEVVRVEGRVKVPGEYPLEPGMRVSDLLRAGGNLDAAAYGGAAELARYTVGSSGARQTELIEVDLAAVRSGDAGADLSLRPFDYLLVRETPDWAGQESVILKGEVRFPGTYPIRRGETLREVLDRAGGLTNLAFPAGSAFTRQELKEIEQQQLDRLNRRMQADLASLTLQAANAGQSEASQALMAGQSLLQQLQSAKAVGRFVIDLPGLLASAPGGTKDVILRDGDELVIPKQRQEVTVIGEIQNPTSHFHDPKLNREDYIAMSGGTTVKADQKRIYIVRADGRVVASKRSLFSRNYDVAIRPGDTVVVPLDTERMPRLPFWQAVTQILYNVAVSVAAVNSF